MATETLAVNLLLNAGQYKREAMQAATATGQIANSAGVATTATGRLRSGMTAVATTAKFALAGAAAAAVAGFVKGSVRAATDLNESINAINVVFGESADEIIKIGEGAADSFGLAQSEFNGFAVRFSNFAEVIARESGETIPTVIEDLTGRIADFASVMNIDVPEAAEKFQSALAGQSRPIAQYGIDVRDAAVKQKALELGIIETGETMTQQEKEFVRYRILMDETAESAGDFKNTQNDLANATRTLTANFEDFKARAGEALTPVLADLAGAGTNLFDIFDSDVNLGWTQRLSAAFQLLEDQSGETVTAYVEQKSALNDLAEVGMKPITEETAALVEVTEESIGAANRHRKSMEDVGDETEATAEAIEELAAAEDEQAEATARTIQAMADKRNALREIHNPLFAMTRQLEDLAEAEEEVAELEAAAKQGTPEYKAAILDRAEVIAGLEATLKELQEQGINPTGAAAREMLEGLGVPPEVINEIFAEFDRLEADFEGRRFTMTMSVPSFRITDSGGVVQGIGASISGARQHGGPVRAGSTYLVGEAGPELFIPDRSGTIVSNGQTPSTSTMGGGASGPTYVFYGDVYGDEGFMRKVREANVQNGRLGLN